MQCVLAVPELNLDTDYRENSWAYQGCLVPEAEAALNAEAVALHQKHTFHSYSWREVLSPETATAPACADLGRLSTR